MNRSPAFHATMKIWAFRKEAWIVPKEFIEMIPALHAQEFILLCYIYNNEIPERGVRLSKKLIAEDCSVSTHRLVTLIGMLEDKGLIKVEQGKSGLSNIYHTYIFAGAREAYLRKAPKDQTIAELTARVFRNPRLKPKPKEIDGGSENKPE